MNKKKKQNCNCTEEVKELYEEINRLGRRFFGLGVWIYRRRIWGLKGKVAGLQMNHAFHGSALQYSDDVPFCSLNHSAPIFPKK